MQGRNTKNKMENIVMGEAERWEDLLPEFGGGSGWIEGVTGVHEEVVP